MISPANQIFVSLSKNQVKIGETLKGEVLLDIHQAYVGSTVLLTVDCHEKVFHYDDCIAEEQVMNVKTELYRFGGRKSTTLSGLAGIFSSSAAAVAASTTTQSAPSGDVQQQQQQQPLAIGGAVPTTSTPSAVAALSVGTSKNNEIFKIPFSIEFSEIFEASASFKVSDSHAVQIVNTITCSVVNYPSLDSSQQVGLLAKHRRASHISSSNNEDDDDDDDELPEIEPKVLCQSASIEIEILHNPRSSSSTLGESVRVTSSRPRQQNYLIQKLAAFCSCFGASSSKQKIVKSMKSEDKYSKKTKGQSNLVLEKQQQQQQQQQSTSAKSSLNPGKVNQFSATVSCKNVSQGDMLTFTVTDESHAKLTTKVPSNSQNNNKNTQSPVPKQNVSNTQQFSYRLMNRASITLSEEPLIETCQVLEEKSVVSGEANTLRIPLQAQPTYSSPVFHNTFVLEIVPVGYLFSNAIALRIPITVTPKKFRLIPRKSLLNNSDHSPEIAALQANIRRLSLVGKTIAKIELKFTEVEEDFHNYQHPSSSNSPSAKTATSSKQGSPDRKPSS